MAVTFGAFAALLPWLILESRRPVGSRPALHVPDGLLDLRHHPRVSALVVCTRSFAVTVARAMEPTPESVVAHWRNGFEVARERAVPAAVANVAPLAVVATVPEQVVTPDLPSVRPGATAARSRAYPRPHRHPRRRALGGTLRRAGEVGQPTTPRARRERAVVRAH